MPPEMKVFGENFFFQIIFPLLRMFFFFFPTILIYFPRMCLQKNDVYIRVRVENGKAAENLFVLLFKEAEEEKSEK